MKNTLILLIFMTTLSSCFQEESSSSISSKKDINVELLTKFTNSSISGLSNSKSISWQTTGTTENNRDTKVFADTGNGWELITSCTNLSATDSCQWPVPNINYADAKVKIELTVSGKIYSLVSSSFDIDLTLPSISSFKINSGAAQTSSRNVTFDLVASDSTNNISSYCIQLGNSTPPTNNSSCWINNTPSKNISLTGENYQLPLITGEYLVYAFVQDISGNISTLSNSGTGTSLQDFQNIEFLLGNPPVVENILISNTSSPQNPPSNSEKTFTANTPVYIKWTASDTEGLSTNPISLYYTTDDINYELITNNLLNSSNASCTVNDTTSADDSASGCYVWNSEQTPSGYFKVRVRATDLSGQITYNSSANLNVNSINFIAGNTDTGLEGSASAAVFFPTDISNATPDSGHMLITDSGDFYFKDKRGLIKVSATDGLQEMLIEKDVSIDLTDSSQEGTITATTKLKNPQYIHLDFDGNILVFDDDRIRKINIVDNTISTVIGGGSQTGDDLSPLDLSITKLGSFEFSYTIFTPLPNGDLIFQSDSYFTSPALGYRIRYYSKSQNKVTSFFPGGFGHSGNNTADLANCKFRKLNVTFNTSTSVLTSLNGSVYCSGAYYAVAFNPTTFQSLGALGTHPSSIITWNGPKSGMDGNSYLNNKVSGQLYKYDINTTSWIKIAGTYGVGRCDDGEIATSCKVHPYDVFTNKDGRVYFFDRGKIRYIDSTNKLRTLMGQGSDYGDGLNATNARFGKVYTFKHWNDSGTDKFIMLDHQEGKLRELSYNGIIQTIAGNGSNDIPTTSLDASSQPIFTQSAGNFWPGFAIDQSNGNVFMNRGNRHVGYLNRVTNRWIDVIGGGLNYYYNSDGMIGSQITNDYGYPPVVIAFENNKLVVGWSNYQSGIGLKDGHYKIYDKANSYNQSPLIGNSAYASDLCSDGTSLNLCPVMRPSDGAASIEYDSLNSQWLFLDTHKSSIRSMSSGGSIGTFKTAQIGMLSSTYDEATDTLYFCATNGRLYKKIGSSLETALQWPIQSISCAGRSIHYNSSRNSLFFIYEQNNLYGLAEHVIL
jgi:hypothetical protein